jgi:hypothetical protein
VEAKKPKESKEDPRLAMMRRKKIEGQWLITSKCIINFY